MLSRPNGRLRGVLVAASLVALAACGGGGGGSSSGGGDVAGSTKNAVAAPTGAVSTKLQPQLNGWAFPNFPSATFPDLNFDTADLVSMFGSGPDVCVDGVSAPCTLTAEAAAWARMVNQARATGHCEGLVVLASARYNRAELPETVKLPSQEEEIRAVMRAFATQFVPEVQKSIEGWTKASLAEKIDELKRSFATDKLQYTLGVYVEGGGHAVLPYAIEYPTPDVARIMVYDSNWPGRNRYVDVDLANDEWSFSFAGDDPAADPNIWSGGSQDMDLTPFEAREGTCPFCGDGTKLQSTTLLVRTENLDWSVETEAGAVSPTSPVSGDGSTARPVKGGVAITRLVPRAGERSSFDYLITIPNALLEGGDAAATTVAGGAAGPEKKRAKLKFGGASSVFAVMKTGVAQFTTPGGGEDKPVELGTDSIKSNDPSVDLTLASGNLVANASGPSVELGSSGGSLEVAVTTATGEVIEQQVTPEAPAVQVKADETGGVTVLEASSTGEVKKTEVAADGSKTETVVDASELNLNKVEVELPPALESKPIAALPKLEDRNLSNPNYKADEAYVPPTTVPLPKENAAGPTTTVRSETPSTVQTRNAALPTTTVARSVTAAGVTPTTIAAVVKPTLTNFRIAAKTFGDDAFTLDPPDSNSPGGFRFSSSRTEVATVNVTTGRVTIVGAGTTTITATQAAVRGYEAGTITATLTVAKARPTIAETKDITKSFGDEPFTVKDPVSTSTGAISYSSSNEDVLKQSKVTGRWVIGGAGRATITVTQAATDDFFAASESFVVTVRKGTPDIKAPADMAKSFLDADFDLPRPTTDSKGAITYASADVNIVSVSGTKASIKSAGTATITASQASTDDWLAAVVTFKVIVSTKAPTLSDFADVTKTFGDDAFTLTPPKSNSTGAFTYTSSDDKVVTVGDKDGKVTIIGPGSATITAAQAASGGFGAGTISAKVTIGKADPTVSDLLVADKVFGDADFTLKATAKSTGKVTFSTDKADIFTVNAETGVVRIVGVGTATLTAKIASTTNYEAGSVSATVTVKKGTPTLTWSLDNKTFGDAPFDITSPQSTSGGSFTYSVSTTDATTVSISGGKLTILKAGTVTVNAKQAATALWNEATASTKLIIDKAAPTITNFAIPAKTYGDGAFDLAAPISNSPVPFTYEIVTGTALDPSGLASVAAVATVANQSTGGRVTLDQAGTVQIRARQVANENFTAGSVTATLTLNKASQLSTASPTFGFTPTSAIVSTPTTLTVVGGAGSGAVMYSVVSAGTTQCIVSQNQQSGSWSIYAMSTGTCSVKAAKAGDRNYLPIESAATNITVSNGQLTSPSTSPNAAVVQNGLISHLDAASQASYPGSGNTWFDISGSGNNATLVGVTKNSAGYMTFSGAGYADWGQPLNSGASYSIDAWVWRNSTGGNQNIASTNQSPFWFAGGPLCAGIAGQYSVTCLSNSTINSWMHVAMTFDDAGNAMKLYFNGSPVTSATTTQTFVKQWLTIGAHNNGGSGAMSNLNGRISSIRLYNRALSATEVFGNYSATAPHCTSSSCQNVAFWMDPADTSTWTASNGAIASVTDKSGSNRGLAQSDASMRPGLSSSTRNGRNYFEFAGSQSLATGPVSMSQPVTMFAVVRNASTSSSNRQVVGNAENPPSPVLYVSGGVWRHYASAEAVSSTSTDQNWHYVSVVFNGSSSRMYLDGVLISSENPGGNGWASTPITIGADIAGSLGWVGDIAEVMIFSGALSTNDRQHTEKYLAGKWGFTQ